MNKQRLFLIGNCQLSNRKSFLFSYFIIPCWPERRCIMIEVLLNPFDDSVLDMNNFIRLIGYTAFMCHYYDGHSRFVEVF